MRGKKTTKIQSIFFVLGYGIMSLSVAINYIFFNKMFWILQNYPCFTNTENNFAMYNKILSRKNKVLSDSKRVCTSYQKMFSFLCAVRITGS